MTQADKLRSKILAPSFGVEKTSHVVCVWVMDPTTKRPICQWCAN